MNERELIERYNDAWNAHDVDAIASMHADDIVFHNYSAGERAEGADAVREHIAQIFRNNPDIRFRGRRLYARDGLVVSEWTATATRDGRSSSGTASTCSRSRTARSSARTSTRAPASRARSADAPRGDLVGSRRRRAPLVSRHARDDQGARRGERWTLRADRVPLPGRCFAAAPHPPAGRELRRARRPADDRRRRRAVRARHGRRCRRTAGRCAYVPRRQQNGTRSRSQHTRRTRATRTRRIDRSHVANAAAGRRASPVAGAPRGDLRRPRTGKRRASARPTRLT